MRYHTPVFWHHQHNKVVCPLQYLKRWYFCIKWEWLISSGPQITYSSVWDGHVNGWYGPHGSVSGGHASSWYGLQITVGSVWEGKCQQLIWPTDHIRISVRGQMSAVDIANRSHTVQFRVRHEQLIWPTYYTWFSEGKLDVSSWYGPKITFG